MSTKLYLHNATATPTVGTDTTKLADVGPGVLASASAITSAMATVNGPTAPLQFNPGTAMTWISNPVGVAVTIAGTVTLNIRAKVDASAANATVEMQILRLDSTGAILSTVVAVPPGTIPAALSTSDAAINYTATPTSTAFAVGDLIGIRIFIDDGVAVTMATAHTVTISFDAGQGSAGAGDTWVQFTEQVIFQLPGQMGTRPPANNATAVTAHQGTVFPAPGSGGGGGTTVRMRGRDGTLGILVYWTASSIDSTGAFYTGPGPLTDIVEVL